MHAGTPARSSASEHPPHVRRLVFLLACATSWLLYLHRYAWGVVKPAFLREYPGLDATQVGWLDAAFNATYALGQIPGGLAGDLLGARAVLPGIILLWSVAMAGVAWTVGFWRWFGVRAAFGLAQAGAYPTLNRMTRDWFPLATRTSVQGAIAAAGRLGAACAPPLIATLLMGTLGFSWQTALLVLALPGVALAVAFGLLIRARPGEERGQVAAMAPVLGRRIVWTLDRASLFNLGMLLVYALASTFQDQLYVYWVPLFLMEGRGLDASTMGLFTSLPLLGGAVGGLLGGMLNDALLRATGNRRWTRSAIGFTGKFVAAGLVLASVRVADGRLAMVVLLSARVFGDWSLPTQWGTITDLGGRTAGTLFGLVNTVGAVGGFLAGPALGFLKQHHGWEGLFLGVSLMCLVAALCWLFIDCTRRLVAD